MTLQSNICRLFMSQGRKSSHGRANDAVIPLYLDIFGIVNGCINLLTQMPYYPEMPHSNTYGVRLINDRVQHRC